MSNQVKYFLKTFFWYFVTLILALMLNFFLPRLIPGNPVQRIVSDVVGSGAVDANVTQQIYESYYKEFGLDQSLMQQFFTYIGKVLHGDLGVSFSQYPRTVNNILGSAIPWTVGLQLPSILLGWVLGNLLGAKTAYKKGLLDKISFPVAMFFSSIPMFVLSIMFLYLFAVLIPIFPVFGAYSSQLIPGWNLEFIGSALYHYVLPFLSLVVVAIGGQAIGMRSMSLYELNSDYILYAKLLGVQEKRVVKYVFRNAVLPQITGLALSLGTMIAGALITEIVFSYPGVGNIMFTAIRSVDYTLISGSTLIVTITVLVANFIIEIIYGFIDPRVRNAQEEG